VESLRDFKSVKRRMELIYDSDNVRIFDDFAHHPTAITETLNGLRQSVGNEPILAILEPRSNTMKQGVHKHLLADSLQNASLSLIFADDNVKWDISELQNDSVLTFDHTEALLNKALDFINAQSQRCNVLVMSNGAFENVHQRLKHKLTSS
jgi:UDP-N-acetylmuramate: L-alanyl-gamma-D-glutamyl-meso-diaminopimelate ligase